MEAVVLAGDAALVFTEYVSMGHLIRARLAARGVRAEFLHGGVPVAARQEIVDRFQSGGGDALVLSVRAAIRRIQRENPGRRGADHLAGKGIN
jgi:SNF2 family DNA or RNA helicase